jgi:hypothetical protein
MDSNDQKMISPAAKGWAAFFSVLLGLTMLLVLLSLTLNFTLFNADFFKGILEKQGFYEQLPRLAAESAIENASSQARTGEGGNNLVTSMSAEQLVTLIDSVLPAGYLQDQIETNVDAAFDFVNLKTTGLNLVIDMQPVKDRLLSAEGQQAIVEFINSLPECADEQVQAILQSKNNPTTSSEVPMCKPPESYMEQAMPQIQASLQEFAGSMPAQMNLMEDQSQIVTLTSSKPFRVYIGLRFILSYVPFIAGALALFIFLLTLHSPKTMFACWGVPLLVSGIIGGLSSATFQYGSKIMLRSAQTTGTPFDTIMLDSMDAFFREFSVFGLILCGVVILVGIIFLLISRNAKK